MEQGNLRRRAGTEELSVSGSARRRPLAQLNAGNLAEVHRPEFVSRSRLLLVADLRIKRAPKEKECRALALSRRRPSASNSNSKEAAYLPQPITDKETDSRKVGRRDNQKKRHRQGSNNYVAITAAAPEREQTNHNRIEVFLCDGLGFRPHLLLNVFRPAYSLGDVTSPNGV